MESLAFALRVTVIRPNPFIGYQLIFLSNTKNNHSNIINNIKHKSKDRETPKKTARQSLIQNK